GDGLVLTGRLSLAAMPWLADHAVHGTVLLPGTAFVDLAVHAGDLAGCGMLEELTLQEPLVLPGSGGVQLQIHVGDSDGDSGRRTVTVSSREGEGEWVRHAVGVLAPVGSEPAPAPLGAWPPAGAESVPVDDAYERLAQRGYGYGPAFRGLRQVWRAGDTVYAEVELPQAVEADVAGFGLHPALLDAALHGLLAAGNSNSNGSGNGGGTGLPFAWSGVRLLAGGARHLRVVLAPGSGGVSVTAFDGVGQPVLQARSLALREIPAGQFAGSARQVRQSLFTVDWVPLPVPQDSDAAVVQWVRHGESVSSEVPPVVVAAVPTAAPGASAPQAAQLAAATVLGWVQQWLADPETDGSRLVIWTQGVAGGQDLAGAAVAGLVRSAQSEHPGRLLLVDVDPSAGLDPTHDADVDTVLAVALDADEPDICVRPATNSAGTSGGSVVAFGRRLVRAWTEEPGAVPAEWDRQGTVLVTGGTGTLGGELARHLVDDRGMRHLVLLSRRGPAAPGVARLVAELARSGAEVRVQAGDAADRDALAPVLAKIAAERPLTAVVHAAGVIDDVTVESLTPERMATVLAAKADAAWNLHELTEGTGLAGFVLYSSAAAMLGSPGQGSYSAANAFLDALAAYRRDRQLAGQSLAWGLWAQTSEMTGHLNGTGLSRLRRGGIQPMTTGQGLALFEAATALGTPLAVPARLDLAALSRAGGPLPPLLRGLVAGVSARPTAAVAAAAAGLAARLAVLSPAEREQEILQIVRSAVAVVLGHAGPGDVDPQRAFRDMGIDSLTALELRNRLSAETGLSLPATLVFDYPTPAAVAGYLRPGIVADGETGMAPMIAELNQLESRLLNLAASCEVPDGITRILRGMLSKWMDAQGEVQSVDESDDASIAFDSATPDEVFDFLDKEFRLHGSESDDFDRRIDEEAL
ncbi:SDR family NAD(P)-dependent oxidoreductase, partial [Streptomyces sp. NPDC048434]|uniref:SDR family NAD(P)-dependent oxidoreductase n=1 Tax=Streptomyces sp. NPDC048434 TaxID=3365549 RepID=UPI0037245B2F